MLPEHGKIHCNTCFSHSATVTQPHPSWRMVNDPGAWGGSLPEYLVLGFSKGSTQADVYARGRFEDIAFAGMRPRLARALRHFGILDSDDSLDEMIGNPHCRLAFGSLIRCSVARRDGRGAYGVTGALIEKSFDEIPHVIQACSQRYLLNLPKSVKAVLMLGTATRYMQRCQALLQSLFPYDFAQVNEVACVAGGVRWVHLTHPSGSNGHFEAWLTGPAAGSGRKRRLAEAALGLAEAPSPEPPNSQAPERRPAAPPAPEAPRRPAPLAPSFRPDRADHGLAAALERTATPTKYIAGFRTRRGREIAIERDCISVYLWLEALDRSIGGIEIISRRNPGQPYAPSQSRNSNLNAKNAPRLQVGHQVWHVRVEDEDALARLLGWYQAA